MTTEQHSVKFADGMASPLRAQSSRTAEDIRHAEQSALEITKASKLVQTLVTTMVAARQLYEVAHNALKTEVREGWECDDPELVLQHFNLAVQHRAMTQYNILGLQRDTAQVALPFLDILLQQEIENAKSEQEREAAEGAAEGAGDE